MTRFRFAPWSIDAHLRRRRTTRISACFHDGAYSLTVLLAPAHAGS